MIQDSDITKLHRDMVNALKNVNFTAAAPLLREAIITSVKRNFTEGGRYGSDNTLGGGSGKWLISRRAAQQSGQTLLDTGRLRNSIRATVTIAGGAIKIEVGSNARYAAIHQFGGTILHPGGTPYVMGPGGKAFFVSLKNSKKLKTKGAKMSTLKYTKPHRIQMPRRPYLVIQNDDLRLFEQIIIFKAKIAP